MNISFERRSCGPGGEPAVEELFELGVQGDVAVVVQFADRDPQPVGGADLHDGVDGEVDELALAHAGAGEELDDETDQGVGVGASSDEQLRRGGIVEEPGQRVVLDRQVVGEERRPGWGVGDAPLDEPLEAQLHRVQPATHGVTVQSTAVVGGPLDEPALVVLDVAAAHLGRRTDVGVAAGEEAGELAQRLVLVGDGAGAPGHPQLVEVAGQRLGEDRGHLLPAVGSGTAAPGARAGRFVAEPGVEQGGLQPEQDRLPVGVRGDPEPVAGGGERGVGGVEQRVGDRVRCDGVQRADLREGRPLPLAALGHEAKRGGGLSEDGCCGRVVGRHDRAEPRTAGDQVVRGDRHPRGEREPGHEPAHSFIGADLRVQRRGRPAGDRAEPRAEGRGRRPRRCSPPGTRPG